MSETEHQLAMSEKIRRLERRVTDLQNLFAAACAVAVAAELQRYGWAYAALAGFAVGAFLWWCSNWTGSEPAAARSAPIAKLLTTRTMTSLTATCAVLIALRLGCAIGMAFFLPHAEVF